PEHGVARLFGHQRDGRAVDTRRRDVAANAIHDQQSEREQHALAQLGDGEQIFDAVYGHILLCSVRAGPYTGSHAQCYSVSAAPPAAAIFSTAFPLNLCALIVSTFAMSPRASTFTRS